MSGWAGGRAGGRAHEHLSWAVAQGYVVEGVQYLCLVQVVQEAVVESVGRMLSGLLVLVSNHVQHSLHRVRLVLQDLHRVVRNGAMP
jgi:hypothetical protein